MNFEHLVEINDPDVPLLIMLDRAQLWSGLMQRVEDARAFLPGLDECRIVSRGACGVERILRWGEVEVSDRVSYEKYQWVRFETAASGRSGGGVLTIRIEEPEPQRLFLRFSYATVFATGHEREDAAYAEFLRQAYEAADIDTVRMIRQFAAADGRH
ncbi:MAG: DUF1857 family protein [Rhodocyclaceae bacterium]|nr:DUF1857 family protein [Rhodocyclaceae bacterium]